MVIAVTGGFGFLGRAIVARARQAGHEVTALGRPDQLIPSRDFDRALGASEPEVIVHAAGAASVANSVSDPAADRRGSVGVLDAVLDAAGALPRPPRVALLSSAAVYGQPSSLPVREDAPLAPLSPYGEHRVECERLVDAYGDRTGAGTTSLRVFSAYGSGLRRQLLWDASQRALRDGRVDLGGTGEETRDFIHCHDVAAAALLAAAPTFTEPRMNVASGEETSVRTVVEHLLRELSPPDRPLRFTGEVRSGDPQRWCADVTLLREHGFTQSVALADGLSDFAGWVGAGAP